MVLSHMVPIIETGVVQDKHQMEAIQLIRLQLALECKELDKEGMLSRILGPHPDEITRVTVYQYQCSYSTCFSQGVPTHIREQIQALGGKSGFQHQEMAKDFLVLEEECTEVEVFRTYVFPESPSSSQFPDVLRLGEHHRKLIEEYHSGMKVSQGAVFGVIRDGLIVSTCRSIREDKEAGECYVFTLPEYRTQGYGHQVTAAWGHHLRGQGKVAFYSHSAENVASQSVARSLGLWLSFSVTTYR